MAEKLLSQWSMADGLPPVIAGTTADLSSMAAGTVTDGSGTRAASSFDVGKLYRRLSDGTLWCLITVAPATWKRIDSVVDSSLTLHNPASGQIGDARVVYASHIVASGTLGGVVSTSGMPASSDGVIVKELSNARSSSWVLRHLDVAAPAGTRFISPTGTDFTIAPGKAATVSYDAGAQAYRIGGYDAVTAIEAKTVVGVTLVQAQSMTIADGAIVRTSGYRSPGDGGGSTYRFVSGDSSVADSGSVVSASGGRLRILVPAGGSANVMAFGAYSDETHSAETTAAFRAARDFGYITGAAIEIPEGRFRIEPDGNNIGLLFTESFKLHGSGNRSVILPTVPGMTVISVDIATTPQLTYSMRRFAIHGGSTQIELIDSRLAATKETSPFFIDRSSKFEDIDLIGYSTTGLSVLAPMIGAQIRNVNFAGAGTFGVCGVKSVGAFLLHHTLWVGCRFTSSGAGGAGMWIEDPSPDNASTGQYGVVLHQCIFEANVDHGLLLKGARTIGYGCYFENNGYGDATLTTTYTGGTTIYSYLDLYDATFDVPALSQASGSRYGRVRVLNHFCNVRLINCRSSTEADNVECGGFGTSRVEIIGTPGFRVASGVTISKRSAHVGMLEAGLKAAAGSTPIDIGVNVNGGLYGGGGFIIATRSVGLSSAEMGVYALSMGYSGNAYSVALVFGRDVSTFSVDGNGNLFATSSDGSNVAVSYIGSRA